MSSANIYNLRYGLYIFAKLLVVSDIAPWSTARVSFTGEKLNYQTHNVLSFMETPRVFDKIDAATEKSISIDLFPSKIGRASCRERV